MASAKALKAGKEPSNLNVEQQCIPLSIQNSSLQELLVDCSGAIVLGDPCSAGTSDTTAKITIRCTAAQARLTIHRLMQSPMGSLQV
ncbi:TPA: hypothetical protein ACH3X2_003618 [Trebouxia sp. C0005]